MSLIGSTARNLDVVKEERYVFEAEWFDKAASLIRPYLLTFYPKDNTIEMVGKIYKTLTFCFALSMI
jgi:hypothetical protein